MGEVAVDFGTCNTVLARYNATEERAETIVIPGVSTVIRYRLAPHGPEQVVWVVPSMIHYSETETLIGDQVLSRGLAEHGYTIRWMKRSIAQGASKRRKTGQGFVSPDQAAEDFLKLLLNYASDRISFHEDEFTFTAPVEAFENFQDKLWRLGEALRIRRLRLLDEPTACILGYRGAVRQDERFLVFDFGGGTLDVSAVRLDLAAAEGRKAVQLGKAGLDLGGMDLDQWIAADFCGRHGVGDSDRRELEALILRQAEAVKIALSDPSEQTAEMTVLCDLGRTPRILRTAYSRTCQACERGRPGPDPCLGCLLLKNDFARNVRETVDRAFENAALKAAMRRTDVAKVLVTGGTSLVPAVRRLLEDLFADRVAYDRAFDAVVCGACRGIVAPILQHDYAIESYHRERKQYEFKPLFKIGTEYPTPPDDVRFWGNGAYDGQTRIGLKIYEVSQMRRRPAGGSIVDESGALRGDSRVITDYDYVCLNAENPTFVVADPPVNLTRDKRRFLYAFQVDGNRRLLVTVTDNHTGRTLLKEHPVVRL
jgi:molecular chaperone DnaK